MESSSSVSNFLKQSQKDKRAQLCLIRKEDGTLCQNYRDSISRLLECHIIDGTRWKRPAPRKISLAESLLQVDEDQVLKALHSFDLHKAAGVDRIKPIVLRHISKGVLREITSLFNLVFMSGYCPDDWLHLKVVFLPKDHKDDYSNARSYRPIMLQPYISTKPWRGLYNGTGSREI